MNNFERDINLGRVGRRFHKDANEHYKLQNEDMLNAEMVIKLVDHHKTTQRPRLEELLEYFKGENVAINQRPLRKQNNLSNNKVKHNFSKNIAEFKQGYLVGKPIKVVYSSEELEERIKVEELIDTFNSKNNIDKINGDIMLDLAIYGRAYELLYRTYDDRTKLRRLDPRETFVIYTNDIDMNSIAAVRYTTDVILDKHYIEVYTKNKVTFYERKGNTLILMDEEYHAFSSIPITEYSNNNFRTGDYEDVLTLIDAYDSAQSDTANYMTDLNDAMLVIKGNVVFDKSELKAMRDSNILLLEPELLQTVNGDIKEGTVDANYIYKQMDVQGAEKYKDRIKNDIHTISNTPNLSDEAFSGNQSGNALRYKVYGLENKSVNTQQLFIQGLYRRYKLLNNAYKFLNIAEFRPEDLEFIFTPNLPRVLKDEVEVFTKVEPHISKETALSLLSFIKDPHEELKKIGEEEDTLLYDFQLDDEVEGNE